MQKMGVTGNTYYIFDEDGNGMSFTKSGRSLGNVVYNNVSLILKNVQDVQVLSILGIAGEDVCDVYFDGVAGVAEMSILEASKKAQPLYNMLLVPVRINRRESQGLLQLMYVLQPNVYSRDKIKELFGISDWRSL